MSTVVDPRTVPGAMEHTLSRELADGSLIEFESAPFGWLKKDGEPRRMDYRAYYWTPSEGKRTRMASVSSVLNAICPKPGLPPWSEARGIEGAVEAIQRGFMPVDIDPREAVERVRGLRLGADRARDDAATRGLNVHDILEVWSRTGEPPSLADHPVEHHGYIRAVARWLLRAQPVAGAIEELVCDPENGYAGRSDLVATTVDPLGGSTISVRWDFKTQASAGIWGSAHLQAALYERAAIASGDEPTDEQRIVVFAEDGVFREMDVLADSQTVDATLAYYRAIKPIDSACDSAYRLEKKARRG